MAVNYLKLNQIVAQIAPTVSDVVPLLEHINTVSGWAAQCILCHLYQKVHIDLGQTTASTYVLSQDYVSDFTLWQNTTQRELNSLNILQNITLVHYTDDIMLIGSYEQDVASILEALVRHIFQTVGNKPSRDSRAHHISKNSGSMVWGMLGYPLQSKS